MKQRNPSFRLPPLYGAGACAFRISKASRTSARSRSTAATRRAWISLMPSTLWPTAYRRTKRATSSPRVILRTKEIENAKKSILIGRSKGSEANRRQLQRLMTYSPKLNILPPSQRALWKELKATTKHFVLYGGTALAFRLGHRVSENFDFFTNAAFEPQDLAEQILYLSDGKVT